MAPPATPAETVEQGLVVVTHAGQGGLREKRAALRKLIDREDVRTALIFCNRKREVGVLHRSLSRHGYDAGLLHGDLAQSQRTEVLDRFRQGELRLLVCSDVAARGLDIEDMSHVFNFDVPTNPEDYVHRIGRTGRAGRSGRAFTIAIPEDGKYVALIEALIGRRIPRIVLEGIDEAELADRDRDAAVHDATIRGQGGHGSPDGSNGRPPTARADQPRRNPKAAAEQERAPVRHGRAAGEAGNRRQPRRRYGQSPAASAPARRAKPWRNRSSAWATTYRRSCCATCRAEEGVKLRQVPAISIR